MAATTLATAMSRAAATLRAHRYDAGDWTELANAASSLATELAYQLGALGITLDDVLEAAERPVSMNPDVAALVQPDLDYALTIAIERARARRDGNEDEPLKA